MRLFLIEAAATVLVGFIAGYVVPMRAVLFVAAMFLTLEALREWLSGSARGRRVCSRLRNTIAPVMTYIVVCLIGAGVAAAYWVIIDRAVTAFADREKASAAAANERKAETPVAPVEPPSLFSLFMNDLKPSVGLAWGAHSDFEARLNGVKVRIFYQVFNDFVGNSYYASFYVPEISIAGRPVTDKAAAIINHIALNYERFIGDIRSRYAADWKGAGDFGGQSTKDLVFAGRIYVYHADLLTVEQLASLDKTFKERGARPQFRGMDYAVAAWNSIRLGDVPPPPKYEVRDNLPYLADKGETK